MERNSQTVRAAGTGKPAPETVDPSEVIGLELPCPLCSTLYCISLKAAIRPQRVLHGGCSVTDDHAFPLVTYSLALDTGLLEDLRSVWSRLEREAQRLGGKVVILPRDE